ncbi:molecular chaperone DjiA [Maritalea porphyrae]|jgi:DnaJ like chaperone protein|uniref:molecular chaperone DjiA n=1 Tax=Maritalea porphyrae TaxID=880732 RepID=UPI0022AF68E6|nr:molecular chaperone DjiA [Maritalea porphyrae]MCZ4272567.1 molecular chaperone DjiA [Maritalea porphyrae]
MSVWQVIAEKIGSFAEGTGIAGSLAQLFDPENWLLGGREAAFTLSLVALSAKMAAADGVVTADEIRAFRQNVQIPAGAEDQVERIFDLAQQDVAGYESYAKRIERLFHDDKDALEHVLDGLFHIAEADGLVHEDELAYLQVVGEIFGFTDEEFARLAARHVVLSSTDPYFILGVDPDASDKDLKIAYRKLVSEHHPDRLIAKGVPSDLVQVTSKKMAAINSAYDAILDSRRD